MDDENENRMESGMPDSSDQQDLFPTEGKEIHDVLPPENGGRNMPPVISCEPEKEEYSSGLPDPVLTNIPEKQDKPPLVFSDGNPLPRRSTETANAARKTQNGNHTVHSQIHLDLSAVPADAGFGDLLRMARVQSGCTLEQMQAVTKLSVSYLQFLENSDLSKLPPMVYVKAYIRTLAAWYMLDDESLEALLHRIPNDTKSESGDVPQTLIESLEKDSLVNKEEDDRIKRMFFAAGIGIVILLVGIIWLIVSMAGCSSRQETDGDISPEPAAQVVKEQPSGKPEFSEADFDSLTAPQVLTPSTLEMNRKPSLMP